jgi:hypothetical protein
LLVGNDQQCFGEPHLLRPGPRYTCSTEPPRSCPGLRGYR